VKVEQYIAGYQHVYLSECERQLTLNPSSVPYLRATLLFCFFAALNLTMLFVLLHSLLQVPMTSAIMSAELSIIGLAVLAHLVLLPNRHRSGSNYMACEAAQIEKAEKVRVGYSLVSSFMPFALLWMLVPRAI